MRIETQNDAVRVRFVDAERHTEKAVMVRRDEAETGVFVDIETTCPCPYPPCCLHLTLAEAKALAAGLLLLEV